MTNIAEADVIAAAIDLLGVRLPTSANPGRELFTLSPRVAVSG
jgi:hypothetical protein